MLPATLRNLRGAAHAWVLPAVHPLVRQHATETQLSRFAERPTETSQSSSGSSSPADARAEVAGVLSGHFRDDAFGTARLLAERLTPAQRVVLAASLRDQISPEQMNDAYLDELYRSASSEGRITITKGKFRDVLVAHANLSEPKGASHPSRNALMMLFLASAIPFIVFGFLDNFIMLTVGEEIDAVFGARLGLTTLASAGLGNCVADVIGVSAAKAIEDAVKRLPFIKIPKMSREQYSHVSIRVAKATGSTAGVLVGCILGVVPLALAGNFFH